MSSLFVREALLQERVNDKVRCNVCERRCLLRAGGLGWCRTRAHRDGRLITLIYGAISSLSANPIEKKPLYHFYPGTHALTAGSWSCNFGCPWCQNWDISKTPPPDVLMRGQKTQRGQDTRFITPEEFIGLAQRTGCQGTSISFNEPTLSLEWSLEVFHLGKERDFYNTFVTNGYMSAEALALLVTAGLDALNVDIKGDAPAVRQYCKGIDVEKVWTICRLARSLGVHLEVTTLVIPTVNDSRDVLGNIAARIAGELGAETPWHVSGYHPAYRFKIPPTPLADLERAWEIGSQAGLEFVYIGNVPGHRYANTYCPVCGKLLIQRRGYHIALNLVADGHCPDCHAGIAGVWD